MAKAKKKPQYADEDIVVLKGADQVRKRPAVIFGSDGIEGCQHSVFEILSNSIDEAREGYGKEIVLTAYHDGSIEIEDHGRGIPVEYNKKEEKYNWELLFCTLYAGGKYDNDSGGNYEFSLGLNGLGLTATQFASEYMDAEIKRDKKKYTLHFEKGENVGGLQSVDYNGRDTGSKIRWKPDLEVFTDIRMSPEFFTEMLRRQAIVNPGVHFLFRRQAGRSFETEEFYYENGIADHVTELIGEDGFTTVQSWNGERMCRDREDKDEYKCKMNVALAFSNKISLTEYYHNSSFLEHGGSPDKAVRNAFVYQIDSYLKAQNKYNKNESKIKFDDVADCLVIVISSFSSVTSYANQTKLAITNKGIQDAMTDFLRKQLEVYFIENPLDAEKIANQVLINKRSRESAEKNRITIKKNLTANMDITSKIAKFTDCRSKNVDERELFIVEGDSAKGACVQARNPDFQAIMPIRGKILNCLKVDYDRIFKSEIITDLIKILGCGVQVDSGKVKSKKKDINAFNIDNLRWNKVIICTDAKSDRSHVVL